MIFIKKSLCVFEIANSHKWKDSSACYQSMWDEHLSRELKILKTKFHDVVFTWQIWFLRNNSQISSLYFNFKHNLLHIFCHSWRITKPSFNFQNSHATFRSVCPNFNAHCRIPVTTLLVWPGEKNSALLKSNWNTGLEQI